MKLQYDIPATLQVPDLPLTRETTEGARPKQLDVNVIFIEPRGTAAALRAAIALSAHLQSSIRLRAAVAVPLSLPLCQPHVSIPFTQRVLSELVAETVPSNLAVAVDLYLCRDRVKALLRVLPANSLVVIAGRRRLWPTTENRLAKRLEAEGHRVIFVPIRKGN